MYNWWIKSLVGMESTDRVLLKCRKASLYGGQHLYKKASTNAGELQRSQTSPYEGQFPNTEACFQDALYVQDLKQQKYRNSKYCNTQNYVVGVAAKTSILQ